MQSLRQIGAGILLSIVSVVIVLGGMTLALTEGTVSSPSVVSPSPVTISTDTFATDYPTLPISLTNTPQALSTTATISLTTPPINCSYPAGWLPITVQPYDNLDSLAQAYRTSVDVLRMGNCLLSDELIPNSILYVPAQPTATLKPCGAPANWVNYTVAAGDTLYRISLLYRVSWQELMQANCLSTTYIRTGQLLKVPNVPTSTVPAYSATPAPIPTDTPIPTLSASATDAVATETPVIPTETPIPTIAPSETPIPAEDTATPEA